MAPLKRHPKTKIRSLTRLKASDTGASGFSTAAGSWSPRGVTLWGGP